MMKTVTALEARRSLGRILNGVFNDDSQFIIERSGKPFAAVVPLWQLEKRDARKRTLFSTIDSIHARTSGTPTERIEAEVKEAVRAVRTRSRSPRTKSGS